MLRWPALATALCLVTACATAGGSVAKGPIKEQMKVIVQPSADTLFAVGGAVDPANGPDAPKVEASKWTDAGKAAEAIKSSGASMLLPANLKDQGAWKTAATQMRDHADAALKAAQAKDGAKLSQAANDLGDDCTACHSKYKNQTAS